MCTVIGLIPFDDICETASLKLWEVSIGRCLCTTEFRLLLYKGYKGYLKLTFRTTCDVE